MLAGVFPVRFSIKKSLGSAGDREKVKGKGASAN
jgi:hypothetical protein